jgi:DNA-binding MarR family transcriptional regulator
VQQTTPTTDPETLREISGGIAATCAGFNLRRASRAVSQHFDHALAPVGLRTTQFTLLGALAIGSPVGINQLSQALVMDRTTLTRNLRLLRDAGLVRAARSRAGRMVRYELTETGRDMLARAIPHWREAQDGIVGAFGPERWPGMISDLYRLVSGTLALDPNALVPPEPQVASSNGVTPAPGNGHPGDQNV